MGSAPACPANSRPERLAFLGGVTVAIGTLALVALEKTLVTQLALITLGAAIFFAYGRAYEKALLLTVVVAGLLPHETNRFGIKPEELMPLCALFVLMLRPRTPTRLNASPRLSATELWVVLLVAAAFQGLVHGLAAGFPPGQVLNEFGLYLEFAAVFIVVRGNLSERGIKYVLWGLVITTLLVSLKYLNLFVVHGGLRRATSDQQHLLNVAIPLLFAFILLAENWRERLVALLLVVPMLPATYVTQTRAIWLYVPISVVLLAVIYVRHRHVRMRNLALLGILSAAGILVIGGYILLTHGAHVGHEAIAERAGSMKELSRDLSLAQRVDLGFQAYEKALTSPIWGRGLGDHLRFRIVRWGGNLYVMDFSYMWVFWKLGVIGLTPLVILYLVFMNRVWFVYRRNVRPVPAPRRCRCLRFVCRAARHRL